MATILITGASGFLGAHVTAGALARGHAVRAGVRVSSDCTRLDRLAPGADSLILDLLAGPDALAGALEGVDIVFNCAAYGVDYRQEDFAAALAVNVAAAIKLAEAGAARGCRLVHVGTSYEYGTAAGTLTEECRLSPSGVYGVTKAAATLALQDFAHRTGADIAVVRPFSMYGPLEGRHKIVPMLMKAVSFGHSLALTPGYQERDYLYVGDVVDACFQLASAEQFETGEIFNICSGQSVTLRALAAAVLTATGGEGSVLQWGAIPYRPAEAMRIVGTPAKLTGTTGWRARTSLADGMLRTLMAEAA